MMHDVLIAGGGVVGLVMVWVAVQTIVRHHSPEMNGDSDVLACRTCGTPDACSGCVHADGHNTPFSHREQ